MSDKYNIVKIMQENPLRTLYKAINTETNEYTVLKVVELDQELYGVPASTVKELTVLQNANQFNIIQLNGVTRHENSIYLEFEAMDRDLSSYIYSRNEGLQMPLVQSYAFQLLCAVNYLHNNGFIHRNIDPSNIFLNKQGILKLGGFECASIFSHPIKRTYNFDQVIWYLAPELLLDFGYYGIEVDMWAVGCVIAEMLLGRPLFHGDSTIDQLIQICKTIGSPTKSEYPLFFEYINPSLELPTEAPSSILQCDCDPLLSDLLGKLLVINPKKRLSAKEALEHPLFSNINQKLKEICMVI